MLGSAEAEVVIAGTNASEELSLVGVLMEDGKNYECVVRKSGGWLAFTVNAFFFTPWDLGQFLKALKAMDETLQGDATLQFLHEPEQSDQTRLTPFISGLERLRNCHVS